MIELIEKQTEGHLLPLRKASFERGPVIIAVRYAALKHVTQHKTCDIVVTMPTMLLCTHNIQYLQTQQA